MACDAQAQRRKGLYPPTYFLMGLVIVVACRFLLPFWAYMTPVTVAAGVMLLAVGVTLNLMSDGAFKKRGTGVSPDSVPTTLVVDGAFRVTRNPMYLGMALIIAAGALLVGAPVGLAAALGFAVIVGRLFIPGEERNLEAAFAEEYLAYKASVRRWL